MSGPLHKPGSSERDWPEDFAHENGQYFRSCVACGETFAGHKRRGICKVCSAKPATPESERDRLWCTALMTSGLTVDQISTITARVLELSKQA